MKVSKKEFNQIYDLEPYRKEARVRVLSCEKINDEDRRHWPSLTPQAAYKLVLDKTVFYPEGGGQLGDMGLLGDAQVLDTRWGYGDFSESIFHLTDKALDIESDLKAELDWDRRFDFMQQHSAEHILSGICHKHYGYDNVGFHLGVDNTTLDFDGPLTWEQVRALIDEANRVIWADRPIKVKIFDEDPSKGEGISYRSKIELKGKVRLIQIDDADLCACAAPHLSSTGQIGLILVTKLENWKKGVRLHLLAGQRAYTYVQESQKILDDLSNLFSLPILSIPEGIAKQEERLAQSQDRIYQGQNLLWADLLNEGIDQVFYLDNPLFDSDFAKRQIKAYEPEKTGHRLLILIPVNQGLSFYLAESSPSWIKILRETFGAKGGGPPQFSQGFIGAKDLNADTLAQAIKDRLLAECVK